MAGLLSHSRPSYNEIPEAIPIGSAFGKALRETESMFDNEIGHLCSYEPLAFEWLDHCTSSLVVASSCMCMKYAVKAMENRLAS